MLLTLLKHKPGLKVLTALLVLLLPLQTFASTIDDVDIEVEEVMADAEAMKTEALEAEKRYQEELKERKVKERFAKKKKAEALAEQKKSQKLIYTMEKQIASEKKLRKNYIDKTSKAESQIEKYQADVAKIKAQVEESEERTKMTKKELMRTEEEVLAAVKAKKKIAAELVAAKREKEKQVIALEKLKAKEKAQKKSLSKLKSKSKKDMASLEKQKIRNLKIIENSKASTEKYQEEIKKLQQELNTVKKLSIELEKEAKQKKAKQSKVYSKYKSLQARVLHNRKKYGAKKVIITKDCNGRSLASLKGQKTEVHKKGAKIIVVKYNKDWFVTSSTGGEKSYLSRKCVI